MVPVAPVVPPVVVSSLLVVPPVVVSLAVVSLAVAVVASVADAVVATDLVVVVSSLLSVVLSAASANPTISRIVSQDISLMLSTFMFDLQEFQAGRSTKRRYK